MEDKKGDLVLSQGMYAFIQDGTVGNVDVVVGPFKTSLSDTDKLVSYDPKTSKFVQCESKNEAIVAWVKATEGQYIELVNPQIDIETKMFNKHPNAKSKQSAQLSIGKKINISGPDTFALYPGQIARVIDGHQLKSNEYLIARVYNDKEVRENLEKSIVVTSQESKKDIFDKSNLVTGKLIVIKGTDVSFFIPPTGMEVVPTEGNNYIRDAETLEMLEYCILLDENGEKRFVNGPAVVFPKPTENFVERDSKRKFKAIELNENMGLYIKVIADHTDGKNSFKAGEELFITGKETKIYYPRPEHSIVTYDNQDPIHYAVTVPDGEARYLLDKETGKINLVKGPLMLLPDPRKKVIVKRILDKKSVSVMFPGNVDAMEHNDELASISLANSPETLSRGYVESMVYSNALKGAAGVLSAAGPAAFSDELKRKSTFTKPRTITLDTKYDGAVTINVWPGYAVQVISKRGDRRVEIGPKVIMLEYDETLEVMELSTGKPKTDHDLLKTAYLQISNNIVSDLIEAETSDMVKLKIRLSYRVNFEEAYSKQWFTVSNYVKLLTQNIRSILRNSIKKVTVDEFQKDGVDLIRDTILGKSVEGQKRIGRKFEENGMKIYDVEVLQTTIDDANIDTLLKNVQKKTIENNLNLLLLKQDEEFFKNKQKIERSKITETTETEILALKASLEKLEHESNLDENNRKLKLADSQFESTLNDIVLSDKSKSDSLQIETKKALTEINVEEIRRKLEAIQPGLIEALTTIGQVSNTEILARNLKEQSNGFFGESGGFKALMETIKGSSLEPLVEGVAEKLKPKTTTVKK
jgi:major vault protein